MSTLAASLIATLVVNNGSDMHSSGFAGIFAPRAMFPTIAGVPQIQEQIVSRFTFHRRRSAASCDRSWYAAPQIIGKLWS